jgi:hypothetical protein
MLGPVGMLAHAVSEDIATKAEKMRFLGIFAFAIIDGAQGQPGAIRRGNFLHTDNNHPASGSNANSCPPVLAAALALPPAVYRWAAQMAPQQPVGNHSWGDTRNNWLHTLPVDSRKKASNKVLSPWSPCHTRSSRSPAPDQTRPILLHGGDVRRGGDGRHDDVHGHGRRLLRRGWHELPRAGQGPLPISLFSFRASIP